MLIATEHTRAPRAPELHTGPRDTSTPRGRSLVAVALVLLALAAIVLLAQSGASGATLFTAVLVNAAVAPLAAARRLPTA
ncbi:MAG TPA: hypothetical protein VNU01_07155 [Egibacteraceae bacterium]|nr:hypothetical protein [Egibacteraceae bacterium]